MKKKVCFVCGGETPQTYNLPHGDVHLCFHGRCQKMLTFIVNDEASPLLWLSKDDLNDEDCGTEVLTKEELTSLSPQDLINLASVATDTLYDDNFGDQFKDVLDYTASQWREQKERKLITDAPPEDLPLLIGTLKFRRNIELFEERLRGG